MAEAAPASFILSSASVLMKVCGEPVSKRATQPNCGNWAAVGLDFGGEGRVVHRYYTSEDVATRTSSPWSDGTFGRESRYPDEEAAADVCLGHSRCRVQGSTSKMQSLLEGESP